MSHSLQEAILRARETKVWTKWFKEKYGREPTREEGLNFGRGFNHGWNAKQERNRINRGLGEIKDIDRVVDLFDLLESNLDACKANLKYIRLELGLEKEEDKEE